MISLLIPACSRRRPGTWRRLGALLASVGLAVSCAGRRPALSGTALGLEPAAAIHIGIPTGEGYHVESISLEDYLVGAVLAESDVTGVGPAVAAEMFEVQAVIARTYAMRHLGRHASEGFDLCSTTHCQMYRAATEGTPRRALARTAVARTRGLVLVFGTEVVDAVYHANCGGRTSPADAIWGGPPHPYLQAVSDEYCNLQRPSVWRWRVEAAALERALERDPRTHPAGSLADLAVLERDAGGRAALLTLVGADRIVRGTVFRAVVSAVFGDRSLKSTKFDVRRDGRWFVFDGRGHGHGAGLCQAGALARVAAGASRDEVLRHYFPGTVLAGLPPASRSRAASR